MPKIILYDPLFNHKAIVVEVGIAALIRLWLNNYYVAYYRDEGLFTYGYYIIRCSQCKRHFLAPWRIMYRPSSVNCPFCNPKKKK